MVSTTVTDVMPLTADIPITNTVLTTISLSSLHQEGYQTVLPFPATAPYQVTGQEAVPKAPGSETSAHNGGRGSDTIRGKMLWHASDNFDVTVSADYTHQNQSGIPNTIRGVFLPNSSTYVPANMTGIRTVRPEYLGAISTTPASRPRPQISIRHSIHWLARLTPPTDCARRRPWVPGIRPLTSTPAMAWVIRAFRRSVGAVR